MNDQELFRELQTLAERASQLGCYKLAQACTKRIRLLLDRAQAKLNGEKGGAR